jgi:hypothetical protein
VLDDANRESQEGVKLAHPLRVAPGEIVIDGNDVNAATAQSIQIDRRSGDEGLAFACGHLGDATAMEHHAADKLNIEVHHGPSHWLVADGEGMLTFGKAAGPVFYHRECLGQQFLETSRERGGITDSRKLLLPRGGFRAQGFVRKLAQRLFDLVNLPDERLNTTQLALIFRADDGL